MVGDSYNYDYKPARDNGIDAILIESGYMEKSIKGKRIIKRMKDILKYI